MKDSSLHKKMMKGLLVSYVSVLGIVPGLAGAEGYSQMLQYELTFGGKQPVSNFYMSLRPNGAINVPQFDSQAPSIRTPLFSTDPSRVTMLNPLPVLYANDEGGGPVQEGEEKPDSVRAIGGLIGFVILIAPIAYGISQASKSFDKAISESLKDSYGEKCTEEGCFLNIPGVPSLNPNNGS